MLLFERGDFRPVGARQQNQTRGPPERGPRDVRQIKESTHSRVLSVRRVSERGVRDRQRFGYYGRREEGRSDWARRIYRVPVETGRIHDAVPDFPFHPFGPRTGINRRTNEGAGRPFKDRNVL